MTLRSFGGWSLFVIALVPWLLSLIIQPYDTMGTLPQNIRPSVAHKIVESAAMSVFLMLLAALLLFRDNSRSRTWGRLAVMLLWLFFFTTGLARALWVKLYVLEQLS